MMGYTMYIIGIFWSANFLKRLYQSGQASSLGLGVRQKKKEDRNDEKRDIGVCQQEFRVFPCYSR